jgi:hypothetical protein
MTPFLVDWFWLYFSFFVNANYPRICIVVGKKREGGGEEGNEGRIGSHCI